MLHAIFYSLGPHIVIAYMHFFPQFYLERNLLGKQEGISCLLI